MSLANNDAIEAKAHADLTVVLAGAGVKYADLTQFERMLWTNAYKLGHASGARDAIEEARSIIGTAK